MASMSKHQRDNRRPGDEHRDGWRVPMVEKFEDVPPVHIDRERLDRAMQGTRTIIPPGLSAEEICSFMDHVAKDVK